MLIDIRQLERILISHPNYLKLKILIVKTILIEMSLNVIHLLGYVELCYGSVGLGLVRLGYFLVTQMGKFYKLTEKSLFK